tara:strand:+ start:223 stop:381 length:159 start_codon:yes stop_codon:yes gene_type:complete
MKSSSYALNNPIKYPKGKTEWEKILEKYGEKDHFPDKTKKKKENKGKEDNDS